WEVLELSMMEESTKDKYGRVFKAYSNAFKGRSQLHWSKGLKSLLIKELTEEEKQEKQEKEAEEYAQFLEDNPLVLSVHSKDWWGVCYHRKRAQVLDVVEYDMWLNGLNSSLDLVRNFIFSLKTQQGFSRGQGERFPCS